MSAASDRSAAPPSRHWIALLVTAVLSAAMLAFVDLRPRVGSDFFFTSGDPALEATRTIDETYRGHDQVLVNVASDDIRAPWYTLFVGELARRLEQVEGVFKALSIASPRPGGLEEALEQPFWRHLLVGRDERSTNIVLLVSGDDPERLARDLSAALDSLQDDSIVVRVAGVPLVLESIRTSLGHDLRTFGLVSVLVFGLATLLLFRSLRLLVAVLVTCAAAVQAALLGLDLCRVPIGILTANLATIVFTLTLSHAVFLTFNARRLAAGGASPLAAARDATRRTLLPSSFCALTTLLGFSSLLLGEATPLRHLGLGGVLGTLTSLLAAYLLFPPLLRWALSGGEAREAAAKQAAAARAPASGRPGLALGALALIVLCLGLGAVLPRLETDPALFEYFDPRGAIHRDLVAIDDDGGSSPLRVSVREPDGGSLLRPQSHEKLLKLHWKLEEDPAVGTSISLPPLTELIDAVARREHPIRSLFAGREEIFDRIATTDVEAHRLVQTFLGPDRSQGLFLLRMREGDRTQRRSEVLERLERTVAESGFEAPVFGGTYALQARLADLVRSSLLRGLAGLLVAFALIALVVARAAAPAAAMLICIALLPPAILGATALAGVPLDVISAPAVNVALGLAVDACIHLVVAARRARADGLKVGPAFVRARAEQWRGVLASCCLVAAGFLVFALSEFPPTVRFGLSVVFGTTLSAGLALVVLPWLAAVFGGKEAGRAVGAEVHGGRGGAREGTERE